jgi:hypothetical protein
MTPGCGNLFADGCNFCRKCGAPRPSAAMPHYEAPGQAQTPSVPSNMGNSKIVIPRSAAAPVGGTRSLAPTPPAASRPEAGGQSPARRGGGGGGGASAAPPPSPRGASSRQMHHSATVGGPGRGPAAQEFSF